MTASPERPSSHAARRNPAAGLSPVLLLPAVVVVAVLFGYPLIRLLLLSLGGSGWSLAEYRMLLGDESFVRSLWASLRISALVTLVTLLLGYPCAYLIASASPRLRRWLILAVLVPFWTSVLVRNFAWVFILQRRGPLNELLQALGLANTPVPLIYNEFAIVLGMSNTLLPFAILPIFIALQALDHSYVEAAETLGARPLATFLTVTLPLSMRGIAASALLVFTTALGFFITPALLGGGKVTVAATYIANLVTTELAWPTAAAGAMILLAVVTVILLVYARLMSQLAAQRTEEA